ncbi:hypothetical protein CCR80_04940 [Rhodothalassium salexigens]|uniref:energy-coupling factor ABC transporter permease n=1 Tax=Rhodothalassium salexigens TaxID=1086 RepID=UPI0019144B0C|nr:energy-coupling factor ABC transporter permease [Rhodothalassium salexigens]MBK5920387.1 hypothetical protein [Rhodothalassium salexigens]
MHIEPGIVHGAKMALAYGTAAGAAGLTARAAWRLVAAEGLAALALRSTIAAVAVLVFFQLLPHTQAGISEVHFIFGTSLLLILGAAPAAIGLAAGLLVQGLVFAPADLAMYAVNVTTLLLPLFAMAELARRSIPAGRAYVDLGYLDVLKLSAAYQGGVVAWVAFWAFYGQGLGAGVPAGVASFALGYWIVLAVEPLLDLALLALAKALSGRVPRPWVTPRLLQAA